MAHDLTTRYTLKVASYEYDAVLAPIYEKVAFFGIGGAVGGAITRAAPAITGAIAKAAPGVAAWGSKALPAAARTISGWLGRSGVAAASEAAGAAAKPGIGSRLGGVMSRGMNAMGRGGQYADLAPGAAKWEQRMHTAGRWGSNVSGVAGVAGMVGMASDMIPRSAPPAPTNNVGANGGNGQQPAMGPKYVTAEALDLPWKKTASGSPAHNARALAAYSAFAAPYVAPHFFERHPMAANALNLAGLTGLAYNGVEDFHHGADPLTTGLDLGGLALMTAATGRDVYHGLHGVKPPTTLPG